MTFGELGAALIDREVTMGGLRAAGSGYVMSDGGRVQREAEDSPIWGG
jgi:hypothetical protein